MKQLFFTLIVIICCVSCSKDDSPATVQPATNKMSFTVNGQDISLTNFYTGPITNGNGTLIGKTVTAYNTYDEAPNSKKFELTLYFYTPDNSYELFGVALLVPDEPVNPAYSSTEYRNLNFSQEDIHFNNAIEYTGKKLKGSFEGTLSSGVDTLSVSSGQIDFITQ